LFLRRKLLNSGTLANFKQLAAAFITITSLKVNHHHLFEHLGNRTCAFIYTKYISSNIAHKNFKAVPPSYHAVGSSNTTWTEELFWLL